MSSVLDGQGPPGRLAGTFLYLLLLGHLRKGAFT
jgi:hypothetical protein